MDANICMADESSDSALSEHGNGSSSVQGKKIPKKRLPNFQEFKEATNMINPSLKLCLTFKTAHIFKEAIREYAIRAGKDVYFKKNDTDRV